LREFLGTAFLLFAVNSSKAKPEAVAGALFANIMILAGPLNGGHFNPAVTTAVLIREGMAKLPENICIAVMIICSQLVGAITGCLLSRFTRVRDETYEFLYPGIAKLCPGTNDNIIGSTDCMPGVGAFPAFVCEVMVTFIFISVILGIKYHNGADEHFLNAAAIGSTLYFMIMLSAGVSGACLNPAVGLIQTIFQSII
jgi:aquaporin Z